MSRLSSLLRQVETKDPQLAADLRREMEALSGRRAFGLNFERHIPETIELPNRPVRKGDKVRFLPERGKKPTSVDRRLWRIGRIRRADKGRVADLFRKQCPEAELQTGSRAVDDLVVVAEFRDPIYPGLVSTGKLERGGAKPFHTVINAENFHALQVLLYTHEGNVDAIYIDPPYNTGARDWKYNNDYVDSDDAYRHSKWLAMMERRLRTARRLLNPEGSVLIVAIDEREVHRLALLLEQVFEDAEIQMVTCVISAKGVVRPGKFSRVAGSHQGGQGCHDGAGVARPAAPGAHKHVPYPRASAHAADRHHKQMLFGTQARSSQRRPQRPPRVPAAHGPRQRLSGL